MQLTNILNDQPSNNSTFPLDLLPNEIQTNILMSFNVEQVADYRTVSRKWSDIGKTILDRRIQNLLFQLIRFDDTPAAEIPQKLAQIFDSQNTPFLNRIFFDSANYHIYSDSLDIKAIPECEIGLILRANKFFTTYPQNPKKNFIPEYDYLFLRLYKLFRTSNDSEERKLRCYLELASTYPGYYATSCLKINRSEVPVKMLTGLENREIITPIIYPWLTNLNKWELTSAIKSLPHILTFQAFADLVALLCQKDRTDLVMRMFDCIIARSSGKIDYLHQVISELVKSNLIFEGLVTGFLKNSQNPSTIKLLLKLLIEISEVHANAHELFFNELNKRNDKEIFTSKLTELVEADATSSSLDSLLIIRFYSVYYQNIEKFNPALKEFIDSNMPTLLKGAFEVLNKFEGDVSDLYVPELAVPPRPQWQKFFPELNQPEVPVPHRFRLLKYAPQLNQKEVFCELFKADIVKEDELMSLSEHYPKFWDFVLNLTPIDLTKNPEILFFYKKLLTKSHFINRDCLISITENIMRFGLFFDPSLEFSENYGTVKFVYKLNRLLDLMIEDLSKDSAYREQTKKIINEHGYDTLADESLATAIRASMREDELDKEQQRMQQDFEIIEATKKKGDVTPSSEMDDYLQYLTDDEIIPSDDEDTIQSDVDDSAQ